MAVGVHADGVRYALIEPAEFMQRRNVVNVSPIVPSHHGKEGVICKTVHHVVAVAAAVIWVAACAVVPEDVDGKRRVPSLHDGHDGNRRLHPVEGVNEAGTQRACGKVGARTHKWPQRRRWRVFGGRCPQELVHHPARRHRIAQEVELGLRRRRHQVRARRHRGCKVRVILLVDVFAVVPVPVAARQHAPLHVLAIAPTGNRWQLGSRRQRPQHCCRLGAVGSMSSTRCQKKRQCQRQQHDNRGSSSRCHSRSCAARLCNALVGSLSPPHTVCKCQRQWLPRGSNEWAAAAAATTGTHKTPLQQWSHGAQLHAIYINKPQAPDNAQNPRARHAGAPSWWQLCDGARSRACAIHTPHRATHTAPARVPLRTAQPHSDDAAPTLATHRRHTNDLLASAVVVSARSRCLLRCCSELLVDFAV